MPETDRDYPQMTVGDRGRRRERGKAWEDLRGKFEVRDRERLTLVPAAPDGDDADRRRRARNEETAEMRRKLRELRGESERSQGLPFERFGARFRLFRPGSRKGNAFWVVVGTRGDGSRVEASSKTSVLRDAFAFANEIAGRSVGRGPVAARPFFSPPQAAA